MKRLFVLSFVALFGTVMVSCGDDSEVAETVSLYETISDTESTDKDDTPVNGDKGDN